MSYNLYQALSNSPRLSFDGMLSPKDKDALILVMDRHNKKCILYLTSNPICTISLALGYVYVNNVFSVKRRSASKTGTLTNITDVYFLNDINADNDDLNTALVRYWKDELVMNGFDVLISSYRYKPRIRMKGAKIRKDGDLFVVYCSITIMNGLREWVDVIVGAFRSRALASKFISNKYEGFYNTNHSGGGSETKVVLHVPVDNSKTTIEYIKRVRDKQQVPLI